jgi:hypothetical protein
LLALGEHDLRGISMLTDIVEKKRYAGRGRNRVHNPPVNSRPVLKGTPVLSLTYVEQSDCFGVLSAPLAVKFAVKIR